MVQEQDKSAYNPKANLYVACSSAKDLLAVLPDAPNIIQL
jgi:hypothetical protein